MLGHTACLITFKKGLVNRPECINQWSKMYLSIELVAKFTKCCCLVDEIAALMIWPSKPDRELNYIV